MTRLTGGGSGVHASQCVSACLPLRYESIHLVQQIHLLHQMRLQDLTIVPVFCMYSSVCGCLHIGNVVLPAVECMQVFVSKLLHRSCELPGGASNRCKRGHPHRVATRHAIQQL